MSIQRFAVAAGLFVAVMANANAEVPGALCAATAMDDLISSGLLDDLAPSLVDGNVQNLSSFPQGESVSPAEERQFLADFAMQLRDVRYRRGGRVPATGFDCSGFVHYVFEKVFGVDLPGDSVSQFSSGNKVAKADLLTGDLVFFHTHGKRVSHVGIYLGEGRFIHSPTTGQRVRVDHLDGHYWARRFVGARRPEALT